MEKIAVSAFVSLDGVMEARGDEPGYRHGGWVMKFPDSGPFKYEFDDGSEPPTLARLDTQRLEPGTAILTCRAARAARRG